MSFGLNTIELRPARVQSLAIGLKPGRHTLECELSTDTKDPGRGKEFSLISVMT